MAAILPNPAGGGREAMRERVLFTLRAAPTGGGELRRRFGHSVAQVLTGLHSDGLIVRDEAGDWWLTQSGREAIKRRA